MRTVTVQEPPVDAYDDDWLTAISDDDSSQPPHCHYKGQTNPPRQYPN